MKKLAIIIILITFYSCSHIKDSNENLITKNDAIKTLETFYIALGTSDTTLLRQAVTNDFYMFEHDEEWNLDDLLELMPSTMGRKWSLNDIQFESNTGIGHITYLNKGVIPSDRSWLESALLVLEHDEVKIKFLHSTKLYLQ
ncbi:MAG TPA: hypothetical protein VIN11_08330 [Roseivirga sp.]